MMKLSLAQPDPFMHSLNYFGGALAVKGSGDLLAQGALVVAAPIRLQYFLNWHILRVM